jgi:two-component system LytT family response regulator
MTTTTTTTSTTPIRALLVDDEPLARKRLRTLLGPHARVQIVGEAANGEEACALVETLQPDLLFLDIQMPGLTGFDVLARLPASPRRPRVIFITAHDEFAVKAFEEQALDYLLKPVEPERLARAISRLTETPANAGAGAGSPVEDPRLDRLLASLAAQGVVATPSRTLLRRIPVRRGARIALVEVATAVFFRAEDKYTVLYTSDAEHVIDRTIDELEQSLDPDQFLRIHRAAIVNVGFVQELTSVEGGRFVVALNDARNTRLVASRSGARTLRERLGL